MKLLNLNIWGEMGLTLDEVADFLIQDEKNLGPLRKEGCLKTLQLYNEVEFDAGARGFIHVMGLAEETFRASSPVTSSGSSTSALITELEEAMARWPTT